MGTQRNGGQDGCERQEREGREAGAPKGWVTGEKNSAGAEQHKKVWEPGNTKVGDAEKQDKGSGRFQPPTPHPLSPHFKPKLEFP